MDSGAVEPVCVYVRVRPEGDELPPDELAQLASLGDLSSSSLGESKACLHVSDGTSIRLSVPDGHHASRMSVSAVDDKVFTYDKVFPDSSTQEDVY